MLRKLKTAYKVLGRITSDPANRDHRLASLGRFLGWQAYKRISRRAHDFKVWDGAMQLRCYPDSSASSAVLYAQEGLSDYDEMLFLRRLLGPGDHVLDIGANVGVYTLFCANEIAPSGRVVCFEPGSVALERLRENVELNGLGELVTVHDLALSDRNGTLEFTTGRDSTNQIRTDDDNATGGVEVRTARLDDIVAGDDGSIPQFAAAKMDIEGAEPLALAGADKLLSTANPPVWLIEINGRLRSFGTTEAEFESWLGDRGFDLALYDGASGELRRVPNAWKEAMNVIAIHRDHWDAISSRLRSPVS